MANHMRVFVVQNQHKWDEFEQKFVPKFDLSKAEEYGELVYLLSPRAAPFRPEPLITELHEKLSTFSDEDSILLVGNPVLIGATTSIAAHYNGGRVNMLQWSGIEQRYQKLFVDFRLS